MVTRISLVRLRAGVGRDQALGHWLGAHADVVRGMPQVRDYVVALASSPRTSEQWDAVATLRFDSEAAMREALDEPSTARALAATRAPFVEAVDVFLAEEHVVVGAARRTP